MLHLHRSESASALLSALVGVLGKPTADVLTPEVVSVPSRGIERWISQGVASRLGVSANIQFPSPQALVEQAIAESTGRDRSTDPWVNGELLWAVGSAVDENMDSPWMQLVASQIRQGRIDTQRGSGGQRTDRVATFQYIRNLFATYHWMRPDMIRSWAQGRDVGAAGELLDSRDLWQPQLWREVRQRLAVASPPELLLTAAEEIAAGAAALSLPTRVSAFGLTRLPPSVLSVLSAISNHREVHLFALTPSRVLWDQVAGLLAQDQVVASPESATDRRKSPVLCMGLTRAADPTVELARNELVASWGRDSRELQVVLATAAVTAIDQYHPGPVIQAEAGGSAGSEAVTLLGRLQQSIYQNEPTAISAHAKSERAQADDAAGIVDDSVQVHSCHGPVRQVQVLRDAILHQLNCDPTLEPRDIVIMCPDVDTYAPHIKAVFGQFDQLRVRIADRSVLLTNPMVSALSALLELADSRCTASQVFSFLQLEPVQARFELTGDDVTRMQDWAAEAGVRWGLDSSHRARWDVAGIEANTWEFGVDRLLAGVVMADEGQRVIGAVRPVDDVASTEIDLVGKLSEFLSRLRQVVDKLCGQFTVGEGLEILRSASEDLLAAPGEQEWQTIALRQLLEELDDEAGSKGEGTLVSLNEFRDVVNEKLSGRPTRTNFRSGDITVCTLTPMRSVPHRVVALLGLDDGAYPRKGRALGDDLTRAEPLVGDHDVRGEDRQLLLDAVLAAQDSLIITYSGRSERTNERLSPAVPLAELLTSLRHLRGVSSDEDVVVSHPLQPFDKRNFEVGALIGDRPWSFDSAAFTGVLQRTGDLQRRSPFWPAGEPELPPVTSEAISTDELVEFFQHPVRHFIVQRLNVRLKDYDRETDEELPLDLDHLALWSACERLLVAASAIDDTAAISELGTRWILAEKASGALPVGHLADQKIRDAYRDVMEIAARVRLRRGQSEVTSRAVRVECENGVLVYGSVGNLCGSEIVDFSFSRLLHFAKVNGPAPKAKPRIAAWIRLLALSASYPDVQFCATVIGRGASGKSGSSAAMSLFRTPENARAMLSELVDLYLTGMRQPLPLFPESSQALVRGHRNPRLSVEGAWTSDYGYPKEDQDPYNLAVYPQVSAADICENPRVLELANQFWGPLLRHDDTRAVV